MTETPTKSTSAKSANPGTETAAVSTATSATTSSSSSSSQSNGRQLLAPKCLLVRNLPAGISDTQLADWFQTTFHRRLRRVVYCEAKNATPGNPSTEYLVEMSSPTIRNQILQTVRRKQSNNNNNSTTTNISSSNENKLVFPLPLQIEGCRSEQFVRKHFPEESGESNDTATATTQTTTNTTTNATNTTNTNSATNSESPASTLASRCILIRNAPQPSFPTNTFPLSERAITDLLQGSFQLHVQRTSLVASSARRSNRSNQNSPASKTFMVELESPEQVQSLGLLESSTLAVEVRVEAVKSERYARTSLHKVKQVIVTPSKTEEAKDTNNENTNPTEPGTPTRSTNNNVLPAKKGNSNERSPARTSVKPALEAAQEENATLWRLVEFAKQREQMQLEKTQMVERQLQELQAQISQLQGLPNMLDQAHAEKRSGEFTKEQLQTQLASKNKHIEQLTKQHQQELQTIREKHSLECQAYKNQLAKLQAQLDGAQVPLAGGDAQQHSRLAAYSEKLGTEADAHGMHYNGPGAPVSDWIGNGIAANQNGSIEPRDGTENHLSAAFANGMDADNLNNHFTSNLIHTAR